MELVTRDELPGMLAKFGLAYGDSALEAALRATAVKPTRYKGNPGGRGRISLFDPMVAWVLASVWEANKRKFRNVQRPMDQFRKVYDKVSTPADAAAIPGFENREFGAQLLMMTSPLYGMEPRDIRRIVREHEETLEYSVYGRTFLLTALQAYNNVYGAKIAGLPVDPREQVRMAVNEQLVDFATAVVSEIRQLLEMEAYNASNEANR